MRIILLQDITSLGYKYDVKDVSPGYARNFLFPRKLAKSATEQALKELVVIKSRQERVQSEEYQKYEAMAEKLRSLILQFKVRVGKGGRAFGSVTGVKIRDALKKQGIEVEKDWVMVEEPIKTTGEKSVKIKFPKEITGEVKVVVEAE